ncbi:MAG TPA: methanol oxidation system protein MoxJ [Methylophaga sp.]|nr:methanol oxidation system protein MoxJ [Methylophaga sp.]HEC58553.1 methanol oxidation system protein MoxJ [Methylophaga sp.]
MYKKSKKQLSQCGLFTALALTLISSAHASEGLPDTLRVCASSNEMPYSNTQQQGFENDIAKVLANNMSLPVEFVWSDKAAIFLVTEQLMKNTCDVVIGVDAGDTRVLTSKPYYKSGYAFIYKSDKGLDVKSWTSPDVKNMQKFAVVAGSPSEVMLREVGKYSENFNYQKSLSGYKSPRNKYIRLEPKMLVGEVLSGKADMAHLWAPEVARYVKESQGKLTMVVSPEFETLSDGQQVAEHYAQSVAVRLDDKALLDAVNKGLQKSAPEINKILNKEGIPLL